MVKKETAHSIKLQAETFENEITNNKKTLNDIRKEVGLVPILNGNEIYHKVTS